MRYLVFSFLSLFALTACSMQGVANRSVPDEVRVQASAVVDQIMSGDLSAVRRAFPDASGDDFDAALSKMSAEVRVGSELARNLVGVQSSASIGTGAGKKSSYNLAYEVETAEGFTVISQSYAADGDGPARLTNITVDGSDESVAAQIRRLAMAGKVIGAAFLLGLLGVGFALLRKRRERLAG